MKLLSTITTLVIFSGLALQCEVALADQKKTASQAEDKRSNLSNIEIKGENINVRDGDGAPLCLVNEGDDITAIAEHEDGKRFKISINKVGCPDEGFVSADFAKFLGDQSKLEIVTDGNGPKEDCDNCSEASAEKPKEEVLEAVEEVNKKIQEETPTPAVPVTPTFDISELKAYIANSKKIPESMPTNRGLVQLPLRGDTATIGPCGSFHYRPDPPPGEDVYTNPLTACVFSNVLQEWNKTHCPGTSENYSGCTIKFGDISDRDKPCWNKNALKGGKCPKGSEHKTHTHGNCIDLRPLTKDGFSGSPLTYNSPEYDRDLNKKFIEFLLANGAEKSTLYFNDPKLVIEEEEQWVKKKGSKKKVKVMVKTLPKSDKTGIHNNHIHVCFKETEKTKDVCNNFKVDQDVCPEFK